MGLFIVVHHIIYIISSTAYRQNKKDQHLLQQSLPLKGSRKNFLSLRGAPCLLAVTYAVKPTAFQLGKLGKYSDDVL